MLRATTERIELQTNMLKTRLIWTVLSRGVTTGMYVGDKQMTVQERARISERALLVSCLLVGWPGGWLAGCRIRHKTSKHSYRMKSGVCLVLNIVASIEILWVGN